MALTAWVHGDYRSGDTPERVNALVSEVMAHLEPGDPWAAEEPGETAEFYFAAQPITRDSFARPPYDVGIQNTLSVSVNRRTGLGAVRWNYHWVACTLADPPADPQVIGDPGYPRWFHPRYTVPLADVEAALREFLRTGGLRPTVVQWSPDGDDDDVVYLEPEQYRAMFHRVA